MEQNIDWGFIFGILWLLSLLVTIIVYQINKPQKSVFINDVSMIQLMDKPTELEKIKITINDLEIEQLNKIQLVLRNDGNKTQDKMDFHIFPNINFGGDSIIHDVRISTSDQYSRVNYEINKNSTIDFFINYFEPKTFIKIAILYTGPANQESPIFNMHMKENKKMEINLSNHFKEKHLTENLAFNDCIKFALVLFLILMGLSYLLTTFGLGYNTKDQIESSSLFKIAYYSPAVVFSTIFYIFAFKQTSKRYFGWRKVQSWFEIDK